MFDTRNLVVGTQAFSLCKSLTSLDLSSLNFKQIVFLDSMFSGCTSLKYLSLPDYMPEINTTEKMFEHCGNLTSINLRFLQPGTNWEKSEKMFSFCTGLKEIVFPKVAGNNLLTTYKMFFKCSNLTSIDIKELIGEKIEIMISMFDGCKSLDYLNIDKLKGGDKLYVDDIFNDIDKKINIKYNPVLAHNKLLLDEIMKIIEI